MSKFYQTNILGYPRIGAQRELKRNIENYWNGNLSKQELVEKSDALKIANWKFLQEQSIDFIPSNDFSFYDQMLDMSTLLGNIPERFNWDGRNLDLDLFFKMARGRSVKSSKVDDIEPLEMTKWFDTNYHYLVPEVDSSTNFSLSSNKIFDELLLAKENGITTKPVLIGPITYLKLSKTKEKGFDKK